MVNRKLLRERAFAMFSLLKTFGKKGAAVGLITFMKLFAC